MKRKLQRWGRIVAGSIVLVVGIIAIPYPGPGWLIVFAGLGILSTEVEWARRLLEFAKGKYDAWTAWIKKQPLWLKGLFLLLTGAVVVTTIWLLNGFGIMNNLLDLNKDWLKSPIFG